MAIVWERAQLFDFSNRMLSLCFKVCVLSLACFTGFITDRFKAVVLMLSLLAVLVSDFR